MDDAQFIDLARAHEADTIAWRRDFHKHPELGFHEVRTAGVVSRVLRDLEFEVKEGIAETGVVGELKGGGRGPTVLLRFDMDALPIQEESEAAYTSRHAGVMHACGHDGHTAVGLTVASILAGIRERLQGGVKFVFQPAEEGLGGAERMIAEGVLAGPELFAAFAFHLWNEKPIGWFAMPDGPMMAGADMFDIRIRGRGGHGANPHQANDPILAAAQITSAIQSVVSRNIDPLRVAVVSVTQMAAGETFNVIPDQASLQGTIRTFDPAVRQIVLQRMEAISIGIAGGMGCTAELEVDPLTPPLVNDGRCAAAAREIASQLFPSAHIVEQERTTGSEDMAFFLQSIPGCYIFIGSSDAERGLDAPHHSPHFDFDERALTHAAALLSAIAFRTLESA